MLIKKHLPLFAALAAVILLIAVEYLLVCISRKTHSQFMVHRVYALSGFPANLHCDPTNHLLPSTSPVQWRVTEDVLVPDKFTEDFFVGEDGHLNMRNPRLEFSGVYECTTEDKVYSTELVVVKPNQAAFYFSKIGEDEFLDTSGSFQDEILYTYWYMIKALWEGSHHGLKHDCEAGYEMSSNWLFCIPCQPGFYSNRNSNRKCTPCREELKIMFRPNMYGQTECFDWITDRPGKNSNNQH